MQALGEVRQRALEETRAAAAARAQAESAASAARAEARAARDELVTLQVPAQLLFLTFEDACLGELLGLSACGCSHAEMLKPAGHRASSHKQKVALSLVPRSCCCVCAAILLLCVVDKLTK